MKRLSHLFLVPFILLGCETKNVTISETTTSIKDGIIKLYVIDSCEYLGNVYGGHCDMLTHKGNCKFCKYRNEN